MGRLRAIIGLLAAWAWLAAPQAGFAQNCTRQPPVKEACVTGFDLSHKARAVDYILPLACQYDLTREVNSALAKQGYDLSKGHPLNDYQLSPQTVAIIQCERERAGLGGAAVLDRATLRLILGHDVLAERCAAAHVAEKDCPILGEGSGP